MRSRFGPVPRHKGSPPPPPPDQLAPTTTGPDGEADFWRQYRRSGCQEQLSAAPFRLPSVGPRPAHLRRGPAVPISSRRFPSTSYTFFTNWAGPRCLRLVDLGRKKSSWLEVSCLFVIKSGRGLKVDLFGGSSTFGGCIKPRELPTVRSYPFYLSIYYYPLNRFLGSCFWGGIPPHPGVVRGGGCLCCIAERRKTLDELAFVQKFSILGVGVVSWLINCLFRFNSWRDLAKSWVFVGGSDTYC